MISFRKILLGAPLLLLSMAAMAAPTITTQPAPASQSVIAGSSVNYSVTATGVGAVGYQWMKRTTGPFANIPGATSRALTLANVNASDAATYRVTVTDGTGSLNSNSVSLSVANAPPVIVPGPSLQHTTAVPGAGAVFSVDALGSGTLNYQWKKNGIAIPGATSATLTHAAVSAVDEADYSVTVSNAYGSATSEPSRLWVVPPTSEYVSGNFIGSNGFRVPYFRILPPGYDASRKYPLWVYFHGASDTESTFLTGSGAAGFSRVCVSYARQAADPIIAVYVTRQSGSTNWNGYAPVVSEMIPWMQENFSIDANRIYIAGQSAGGKPAVDLVTLHPQRYAGLMICNGTGDIPSVGSIRNVPLWAVWSQGDTVVTGTPAWVQAFRDAGGRAVFTQFATPTHANSIMMGFTLPPAVDWLFSQRRGVPPSQEPLVSFTSPGQGSVVKTAETNVSLAGSVAALESPVTGVTWQNLTTGATGAAAGTTSWNTGSIALASDQSSILQATATVATSWAPAYGGSTTSNNNLIVTKPFDAALVAQSSSAMQLSWLGGYPPYRVESSPDLTTWTEHNPNATSPVSVPISGPQRFYRVTGR